MAEPSNISYNNAKGDDIYHPDTYDRDNIEHNTSLFSAEPKTQGKVHLIKFNIYVSRTDWPKARYGPNHGDLCVYNYHENPEEQMLISDTTNVIDFHVLLHQRYFSKSIHNEPVLFVNMVNPLEPFKMIPIKHYDARGLGHIIRDEYRGTRDGGEYDIFVRKIHMDDVDVFDKDLKDVRLYRYPRRFDYIVFTHLKKYGLIPVESASSKLWSDAEKNAGNHVVYRMNVHFA